MSLVFYFFVIEDVLLFVCKILFNGIYFVFIVKNFSMLLFFNCFVGDFREGYYMIYYWFKVFDWNFVNILED